MATGRPSSGTTSRSIVAPPATTLSDNRFRHEPDGSVTTSSPHPPRLRSRPARRVATTSTSSGPSGPRRKATACSLEAGSGETELFILPGFRFQVVDALVTNFHLPKSTLLMLVSAFAGMATVRRAYAHAVAERYRFFSYGDAMFLTRNNDSDTDAV